MEGLDQEDLMDFQEHLVLQAEQDRQEFKETQEVWVNQDSMACLALQQVKEAREMQDQLDFQDLMDHLD